MKRFDNVVFGRQSKLIDYENSNPSFSEKVVDDSHFVPRVKQVRDFIASGGKPSDDLVYDFKDGVDTGFSPTLRKLNPDPVEVDLAIKDTVDSAKSRQSKIELENAKKQKEDLEHKLYESLTSDDSSESASSSNSQE